MCFIPQFVHIFNKDASYFYPFAVTFSVMFRKTLRLRFYPGVLQSSDAGDSFHTCCLSVCLTVYYFLDHLISSCAIQLKIQEVAVKFNSDKT